MNVFRQYYRTPEEFDDILLVSDGEALTGLFFTESKDFSKHFTNAIEKDLPIFRETKRWLDIYFSGENPDFTPKYSLTGATPFREEVSRAMQEIPFGETTTYRDIAEIVAKKLGKAKMSCRAVGGAVGWNPICIIVPCHRVVGADGRLTGYGGGMKNKIALLKLEKQ